MGEAGLLYKQPCNQLRKQATHAILPKSQNTLTHNRVKIEIYNLYQVPPKNILIPVLKLIDTLDIFFFTIGLPS